MATLRRKIIEIDEEKCDGCGKCVPDCKEGALRIVDGKAKLVGDVYCDGLGDCVGACPRGALTIVEREARLFDETALIAREANDLENQDIHEKPLACGCPGTMARSLSIEADIGCQTDRNQKTRGNLKSALEQWPVQLSLIPVNASYLENANFLLLADCAAVAYASLHSDFIKGRVVAMACPKLDDTTPYLEKLAEMMQVNSFRSFEVVMMEVPCCGGLMNVAAKSKEIAESDVRIRKTIISVEGKILDDL